MKDQTQTTISASEFINFLKELDLVIVNRNEFLKEKEREKEKERRQILEQELIRISKAAILLNETPQNIHRKIKSGEIKRYEYKISEEDKRGVKLLTQKCVLRLIESKKNKAVVNKEKKKTKAKKIKNNEK